MSFDTERLEPAIRQILSAPGTDLSTISAKRVRKQLLQVDPSLTVELLKENKEAVDKVIGTVFEAVSAEKGGIGEPSPAQDDDRKRKHLKDEDGDAGGDDEYPGSSSPPPKKAKKAKKQSEIDDEELARQLSSEINGRSRRSSANGAVKKAPRKKKSSALVDSDEYDSEGEPKRKSKRKSGGGAKGGFSKEYNLSAPLSSLLGVDKLSRPQVVKQLWEHIKGNDLQNPSNKREIICDGSFKAIFNVDKIDMFRMNKVLGQHLHEIDD